MNEKISQLLSTSLNLTADQTTIYLAALELGQSTMQDLARKSKVKRTSIYNFIDALKDRQLIIKTKKGKKKMYSAANPSILMELEKSRMRELETVLPELSAICNESNIKPRVTYHEGVEGIKEVYADMLKENKPIIAWEDLEYMRKILPKNFFDYFPAERAKLKIPFKSILRRSEFAIEFVKKNKTLLRDSRFIRSEDLRTEINIYGNKVALMSFRDYTPFVVLIDDPFVTQTLRVVWEELWNRLTPLE